MESVKIVVWLKKCKVIARSLHKGIVINNGVITDESHLDFRHKENVKNVILLNICKVIVQRYYDNKME
jgi:hypothetical protein